VSFGACVGRAGTCGGGDCCATNDSITLLSEDALRAKCTLLAGSRESEIRVDLEIVSGDNKVGIRGDDLTFDNNPAAVVGLRACDEFMVKVAGNEYPTTECGNVDVRTEFPPGGGCEIQMNLDTSEAIVGRFRCKELQLPSQAQYFSTLYEGELGWGEFRFENCADRR